MAEGYVFIAIILLLPFKSNNSMIFFLLLQIFNWQ